MTFSYSINEDSGIHVISLSGELISREQAAELSTRIDELISGKPLKMVFDLKDLKYINSSGLNVMINVLSRVRKSGGDVVITNVSKRVNELLIITKLNTVFTVTETLEKAKSQLN